MEDNVFSTGSAQALLSFALKAAELLGENSHLRWREVSENMRCAHFDKGVMRERSTFSGEIISQAEVYLLGYPLESDFRGRCN